jgi:hypothetical protein
MHPGEIFQASQADDCRWEKPANWSVHFFQLLFLVVMLFQLDAPFLSAHNERQNDTFDMARHVFHDGWRSIVMPKVSYTRPGFETERFTAGLGEVSFHGVIGWPLTLLTSHERAVVRLVSTAFALISIQLLYWILRFWLPPAPSAVGAALWATAPLTLHFGQVPMPDILCTTGTLAAFWFALRGRLPASSGCFLFGILAKLSVLPFGLPILVALLVARNCRSKRNFLQLSLAWGWLPLLGPLLWMGLIHWFAPPNSRTITNEIMSRGDWITMVSLSFYKLVLGCLFPFGLGVLGFVGVLFAMRAQRPKMDQRIKWAIIGSNLYYLAAVVRKVPEPQYLLPMLAWCVIPASFGFNLLMDKLRAGAAWRIALGTVLILHVLMALAFTIDLKASRVPNFPDIERAAQLLPPDARVVVVSRFYGCSAAVWLNRNVVGIWQPTGMAERFTTARRRGFTHVLILDIESRHGLNLPDYADPASPFRRYCDQNFSPLFVAPHVVLYSMTPPPAANQR